MAETASRILEAEGLPRVDAKELEGLPKESDEPLLVAFVAEWCEVSREEAPVFAALAGRFRGRVRFAFADVDRRAGDAARLSVRSVPAVIIFAKERELERKVGAATEDELARLVEKALDEYAKIEETEKAGEEDGAKGDAPADAAPLPEGEKGSG
ncbi:MAG: thioredoxin family protein [Planctomycetota bacterium]|jgi:thioredoxin-like negative regulator of GroEL